MGPRIRRRAFIAASGTTGIAAFAGCIGEDAEDQEDDQEGGDDGGGGDIGEADPDADGQILSWHAGGTSGTYYPLSGDFKAIVEEHTPHGLQVQSTGASVENVGSLSREDAHFALIQNDIAHFAATGTGIDEFEGEEVSNLRGVATLYPETIHIVTQSGSDIESIDDLEGASVNTGDLGSGTQVNALQILDTAGIGSGDFTEQNADFETAADQLRDGDVDASFVVGGWPVGSVEELATTDDISLIELPSDLSEEIQSEAEWFASDTVPAGTYDGIDEDVETVSVQAMIATHDGVDEDIVEEVTTAIFDNTDDIGQKSDFIDADSAQDAMPIDLHAGAQRYFE
ncbi:C4-dicarboxylate ABC transporter substrate-binding protein [Halostagnicola larsenii XH-48]|uniref:C4-dicarboxylate ABC transporter substrate-binding protein n=1 Tax=Halostagnicola larsenii XH-48 TaxID=797299 RepID=W0JNM6_9EURY|nr:TAXI family TRAP transporter solute-binding subunit [Halostagnicola larsenii]AHF98891.1 C4-dicarboxylate ABC transporter substrate-binding protein [Halostagnicola larsenii XH-48]